MTPPTRRKVYGLKMLREDGGSLNSDHARIIYPLGKWITVPGNGAYVAVTNGLDAGGVGPVLALFECREEVKDASPPAGVKRFREVRMLSRTASEGPWSRYEKVRDQAWAEYEKVRDQAWAEHQKVCGQAWAEHQKVCGRAWAEYQKVRDQAWAEYQKVCGQAWAEYQKVRDQAWAEHQKVCGPAWRALMKEARKPKGGRA